MRLKKKNTLTQASRNVAQSIACFGLFPEVFFSFLICCLVQGNDGPPCFKNEIDRIKKETNDLNHNFQLSIKIAYLVFDILEHIQHSYFKVQTKKKSYYRQSAGAQSLGDGGSSCVTCGTG